MGDEVKDQRLLKKKGCLMNCVQRIQRTLDELEYANPPTLKLQPSLSRKDFVDIVNAPAPPSVGGAQ
jgi:hypothetical protein